jgi:hypothetical protein
VPNSISDSYGIAAASTHCARRRSSGLFIFLAELIKFCPRGGANSFLQVQPTNIKLIKQRALFACGQGRESESEREGNARAAPCSPPISVSCHSASLFRPAVRFSFARFQSNPAPKGTYSLY